MNTHVQFESQEATEFIQRAWGKRPAFGIILGTGAGELADEIDAEVSIPYGEIPNFPVSTAMGHAGQLVCGRLAGADVVAMQGRFHLYEGYQVDKATLPVHTLQRLGVKTIFVSNAAGGLNPKMASGDIMLIDSHIDLMNRSTRNMVVTSPTPDRPALRSDIYDRDLIEQALRLGRENDFAIHQGVYAAMLGPNYETRAEYRMLRKMGADVAGMSTVPEVTVASVYGIRVLAMSIVTNVADPDVLEPTSGQEVIDAAKNAAPNLKAIVVDAIVKS